MTVPNSKDAHVLIIGAGITGLILAQSLKKAGIRYSIFEKEVSMNYRSNEWTMAIHWSLDRLRDILPADRFAHMESVSCNPDVALDAGGNYPIIHGETGHLIAGVPYAKGLRVPRSKMRDLCSKGIEVQYGKNLIDVAFTESQKGVVAFFDDGSMVSGTILIGADGPRSKVREFAMGSAEKAAVSRFPIFHTNMTVTYNDAEKARYVRQRFPTSYLALSDKSYHAFQSISSMPDGPDHPESWVFHLAMAWFMEHGQPATYRERLDMIREKAQSLAEPARSSFTWIPDDTQVHKADISYWVTQPWDNRQGRLTLIGDAAHPMPPYRGQGLNHCICDTSHLLAGIQKVVAGTATLKEAITAYEAEMIPRGREEVKCSVENGYMLHDWDQVRESPVFRQGFRPMSGHDRGPTFEKNVAYVVSKMLLVSAALRLLQHNGAALIYASHMIAEAEAHSSRAREHCYPTNLGTSKSSTYKPWYDVYGGSIQQQKRQGYISKAMCAISGNENLGVRARVLMSEPARKADSLSIICTTSDHLTGIPTSCLSQFIDTVLRMASERLYALTIYGYRKPGMPEDEYHRYLSEHHAVLVRNHLVKMGIVRYTLTHNTSETKEMMKRIFGDLPEGHTSDCDCLAQIMFRDVEDYVRARNDPHYKEVIFPDHANFADSSRTLFVTGWVECHIVDGGIV
ncbi:FAD/NAD(P)-binding domain-containing protein [Aspergillus niger CBS 101883]|uniref:FAD/NAD(P)-binding domain-containing protein n=1 Tax=Aspergillus lacticoffeatus (strain CBS 101883) TaxID=1450533 RepID=UPI000D802E51|nr:FAD/NAD(P)-binding domain-containing protein [Aspergillus niger CBS 101883]PYH58512.1 FAD/NAD(P)-binding domain-containing protein [Aspergillus niger CBS 101883]